MTRRVRAANWEATPLGDADGWPASLRMATQMCLSSRFPMMLAWGAELTQIYNEAWIPILGEKHPQCGRPLAETWADVYDVIGPMLSGVMSEGQAVYQEDALMWVNRIGFAEDTYFTFSFSPIFDSADEVGGVLITALETTSRVLDARRFRALGELSAAIARGPSAEAIVAAGVDVLSRHDEDMPFALVCLRDPDTHALQLCAPAGGVTSGSLEQLTRRAGSRPRRDPVVIDRLDGEPVIHPLSGCPVRRARAMPLGDRGVLVTGLSPVRRLDDAYLAFLDLVAAALARGIAAADAYDAEHQRADALIELDRAKTEFLQNVSHELRTPLTLIRAPISDMIDDREEALAGRQRSRAEMVQRNAERLARMVDGLLDFSRASADSLRLEPTDLPRLTEQLVALFESGAEQAGIGLEIDVEPASAVVLVDREAWERIVLNLVSNALKYTHAGSVRVSLRIADGNGDLKVLDTGIGIAAEDHAHVFERFGRVRQDAARSYEGVGIGLALVRQLAQRLGGDVEVESALGIGSCFTVRISAPTCAEQAAPAHPTVAATAAAAEAKGWHEPQAAVAEVVTSGLPLVLCADDSADMREYVTGALSGEYRVVTVGDGIAALAAVRRERPDLVLTDVMMPRMGGLELVRALRADPATATVPVVIFSARAGDEASAAGLETGADDYVVKPFSPRELRARVRTHVELVRNRALVAQAEYERHASELIRISEQRLRSVIAASGTGIFLAAGDGVITDANPALCELLRRAEADLTGMTLAELTDPDDSGVVMHEQRWLRDGRSDYGQFEVRLMRGDGEPAWVALELTVARDEDGAVAQWVASIRDVRERRRDENRLRFLADHDALTGLFNRRRFGEELARFLAESHRHGSEGAVVLLDLDGLKLVNDNHGHALGDTLLCAIADLMRSRMRETDVLARLGGDEFALLLPHARETAAMSIARDLQHRIRQSADVLLGGPSSVALPAGAAPPLSATVGIALISAAVRWTQAESILADADSALFMAKRAGAGSIRTSSGTLRKDANRLRTRATERIRDALAGNRFELFAQPIVGLCGDTRPRYELLLRLRADSGEIIGPGSFLPDAERSDLILEIDRWVIDHSARVLRDWQRDRGPVTFHVNVSAPTVTSQEAADVIAEQIERTGVDGRALVYEITETTAIASLDRAHDFARRMRELGCGLALDDFGSGFASFAYLKNLDYDYVKLDGNLVEDVACNIRDRRILQCIAELTRGMGKRVIAERVADARTLAQVQELGIDYAQGFHLGRAAAIEPAATSAAGSCTDWRP
jgi:diguanylate cyclase (GGDEF)-like protein/PAS domain S-box-containing protein